MAFPVFIGAMLFIWNAPEAALAAHEATVADVFRRYARGEFDQAVAELRRYPASAVADEAPSAARQWLRQGDSRSSILVSVFALEAAHAALFTGGLQSFQLSARSPSVPTPFQRLVEWGRRQLGNPLDNREHAIDWFHAAVALGEQAQLPSLVTELATSALDVSDSARFRLALAVAVELRTSPYGGFSGRIPERDLREARRLFLAAAENSAVRGEAKMRLGFFEVRAGQNAEGLAHLSDAIEDIADRDLLYLAHLFRARALEVTGRVDEAAAALREAIHILPSAQTGKLALAVLQFESGNAEAASDLAEAAIDAQEQGPDPWRSYWTGDGRLWHDLVRKLRARL